MNKNSVAPRPPMGWNSYDYYDTNVTEAEVLRNAEYMAEHLRPFGWEYIVVDIQWYAHDTASMRDRFQYIPFGKNELDCYGRLLPCPEKFPSSKNGAGFKPDKPRPAAGGPAVFFDRQLSGASVGVAVAALHRLEGHAVGNEDIVQL